MERSARDDAQLTIPELVQLFGRSRRTVFRAVREHGVATNTRGPRHETVVDPYELQSATGWAFAQSLDDVAGASPAPVEQVPAVTVVPASVARQDLAAHVDVHEPPSLVELVYGPGDGGQAVLDLSAYGAEEIEAAHEFAAQLARLESMRPSERSVALAELAAQRGDSVRWVRSRWNVFRRGRWMDGARVKGWQALLRKRRSDSGRPRLEESVLQQVMLLWLRHPRVSAGEIQRILERYHPELLMIDTDTGTVGARTIQRVRRDMERIPALRAALASEDERKEMLRMWGGRVVTQHANQLWEMDMTRCDTFVFDPHHPEDEPFRLRIHAVIDHYSGAVPGIYFSRKEDQTQTDRMLMLAISHETHLAAMAQHGAPWPVFGKPERLYADNGRTYTSTHASRVMAELGIEEVHSQKRVSHSRGAIERFFAVLHQGFEKRLPGYAGEDVVERDAEHLKVLRENTLAWARAGYPDHFDRPRLLTESEYKRQALLWLLNEYHQGVPDGSSRTRLERWADTAPEHTLPEIPFEDLRGMFRFRHQATVRGNGMVRYRKRNYALPGGLLAPYQGQRVTLLIDRVALDPDVGVPSIDVAIPNGLGRLKVLGTLQLMSDDTLAPANRQHVKDAKAQVRAAIADGKSLEADARYLDPTHGHVALPPGGVQDPPVPVRKPGKRFKPAPTPEELWEARQRELEARAKAEGLDFTGESKLEEKEWFQRMLRRGRQEGDS